MEYKDPTWKECQEWLDQIRSDVVWLFTARHIFREVWKMVENNQNIQIESAFYDWILDIYTTTQAIGVRRHVDKAQDVISFARLLTKIQKNPHIFESVVNTSDVDADLKELTEKAESIKTYVNKKIAHLTKTQLQNPPLYADIDGCLDYLGYLLKKYTNLLHGRYVDPSIPPIYFTNWKEIFRYPWIKDK